MFVRMEVYCELENCCALFCASQCCDKRRQIVNLRFQVFMTKKRIADSKSSEFKGGDFNKYTSRSYTIQGGNEIFGGEFLALGLDCLLEI